MCGINCVCAPSARLVPALYCSARMVPHHGLASVARAPSRQHVSASGNPLVMAHIALANLDRSDSHRRDDTAPLEHLCYHFFVVPKAQLAPAQQNIRSFFLARCCGFFFRREDRLGLQAEAPPTHRCGQFLKLRVGNPCMDAAAKLAETPPTRAIE